MNSSRKKILIYSVQISDIKHQFSLRTELHKQEKSVLVALPNPKYLEQYDKYHHLKDLEKMRMIRKPFYTLMLYYIRCQRLHQNKNAREAENRP